MGKMLFLMPACFVALLMHILPVLADDRLEKTFADIDRIWEQELAGAPREQLLPALRNALSALDEVLENGKLSQRARVIVQYYRARALFDLAGDSRSLELGEAAIMASEDVLSIAPGLSDAAHIAGLSAYNILNDVPRAFDYWKRCAAQGHAGCMNVVVDARLTGADGLAPNSGEAIAWHEIVAATGKEWTCAGSYSALAAAEIMFWRGGAASRVLADQWLARARSLVAELEVERPALKAPSNREK